MTMWEFTNKHVFALLRGFPSQLSTNNGFLFKGSVHHIITNSLISATDFDTYMKPPNMYISRQIYDVRKSPA